MPCPPINGSQADRFLLLLGKSTASARLRAFPHRLNPNCWHAKDNPNGIKARKGAYDLAAATRWQREGRGVYLVINNGGDRAHEITSCSALFVEWDNRPLEWQLTAWRALGLGEPSIIITTGGKSAHCYWLLDTPCTPEQWLPLQARLIEVAGGDPICRDLSRVMRLPGAYYIGPDGQPTGQSVIHSAPGHRYTLADIEDWLAPDEFSDPAPTPAQQLITLPDSPPATGPLPDRPPEALIAALQRIPPFAHGQGQRELLLGLALRLHVEIGRTQAIDLLRQTCAGAITDLEQGYFNVTPREISTGSVWPYLRDHWGIDISRRDLHSRRPQPPPGASHGAGGGDQQQDPQQGGSGASGAAAGVSSRPPLLSLDEVRERLRYAVDNGASRQDLEALRIELAGASDLHPATLSGLLAAIQREQEAAAAIAAEAESIQAAADRAAVGQGLTLDFILPAPLARALRIRTQYLPVDDVAAAMSFLVALSGVAKLGTEIIAAEALDFRAPLNLYAALVARSGAKKSPISRLLVSHPSRELRQDLARQYTRQLQEWNEENRDTKPADRTDPPRPAYLVVADATSEALSQQLQVQEQRGLGLLFHRDELAGLFGSLNAYRKGRGGDEEQLLEAYDGSGQTSLRIAATGGGRFYERCHLSIWGTIQPPVLQSLVADGDASGLWARFLFLPLPDRIVPIPEAETQADLQASAWAASTLADACRTIHQLAPPALRLTPDARRAFVGYEARCQADVRATTIPAQGALWGKSAGKVLRIAGLLHLAAVAVREIDHYAVGEDTIRRAATIVDHLNAWTLSLHQAVADGGTSELMRLVHRVAEATREPIRWKEVAGRLSKQQRRDTDSAAVTAAMRALAELGAGEIGETSRGATTYKATGALP